ncbi:MAG: hypothetical protein DWQ34_26405 [Planctomycetota bacterium]|nr:MAG: hypothetical protein DWQ34_26405 [Planctomycetota bacterium]REK33823.1 MAG: hypothetical protein DWQ45_14680 [Planctomycetota bacterium]
MGDIDSLNSSDSTTATDAVSRWLGASRTEQVREALSRGGVQMQSAHVGELKTSHFKATVTLEADDTVRIRAAFGSDIPVSDSAALEASASLPGNARFAMGRHRAQLAAETRLNGVAHLPESLREIRRSFSRMLGRRVRHTKKEPEDRLSPAVAVKAAIDESGWDEDRAIETDAGWELRPRLNGQAVPVELVLDVENVHLRRTIINEMPSGNAVSAVAHQALSMNDRLRGCRLAVLDRRLVAECTLRPSLINIEWLIWSSTTVAAAARSVGPEIRLLAENADIARQYLKMFLPYELSATEQEQ